MKKTLFLLPLLIFGSLFAYPRCAPELEHALHTLYHFPEAKALLEKVEAQGAIQVKYAPFRSRSPAMWVPCDRTIVINANLQRPFGEIIRSIFFELHNASTTSEFIQLDTLAQARKLSKHEYVESVERLEHKNAYSCACLVDKAVRLGYFPREAEWYIPANFQLHFQVQQESGHSQNIASTYDDLAHSYYGSL